MSAQVINLADARRAREVASPSHDALVFAACFGFASFWIGVAVWAEHVARTGKW